jgi:hypothetical protein
MKIGADDLPDTLIMYTNFGKKIHTFAALNANPSLFKKMRDPS